MGVPRDQARNRPARTLPRAGEEGARGAEVGLATPPLHVPKFIVIGGPEIHAGYVRRLFKAEAAGKIAFDRILVIDRDPGCPAASLAGPRVSVVGASWDEWLGENLSRALPSDHVVPYHWAPHVLLDWLTADLARRGLTLRRTAGVQDAPVRPPVSRPTKAGDLALSYAEWLCPPACIEPALCPHTRGPKSWSLASELAAARRSFAFPCLHLAYGVGTIPVSTIFEARDRLVEAVGRGEVGPDAPAWIASASHCHGLAARVQVRRKDV